MAETNVRWGFLGAGGITSKHLGAAFVAARGATVHAVAARDADRAAALAQKVGASASYGSYQELIDDPDVDAVYIGLANDAHAPWTLAALAAGKHVLCEKPLGMTAAEVEQMVAAADAAGRVLVEASWYRWHPRTQATELLIADGTIGAVTSVDAAFALGGVSRENYRYDPARGGGALYDLGCYPVSAAVWAFGGQRPLTVKARIVDSPSGVDIVTEATLRFADGGAAHLYCGMEEDRRQALEIVGDAGTISFAGQLVVTGDTACELVVTTAEGERRIPFPPVDAYRLMVEAVSTVIAGGEAWVLPLEQSVTIAHVIDDIFAAGRAPQVTGERGVEDLVTEWLALPDVADALELPFMKARQLLGEGKLVALRHGDNNALYVPALFLQDGAIVKHLSSTLIVLKDAGYSDEEAVRWLFTPDDSLPGSPLDALRENRGTEVKRRAQALGF